MINALRIIIAKSPAAGREAIDCIRAVGAKSPVVQQRYNRTVKMAFSDPGAEFTPAERAEIALHTGDEGDGTKKLDIRVRVTPEEKEQVQAMASAESMTVSDFIRDRIGL